MYFELYNPTYLLKIGFSTKRRRTLKFTSLHVRLPVPEPESSVKFVFDFVGRIQCALYIELGVLTPIWLQHSVSLQYPGEHLALNAALSAVVQILHENTEHSSSKPRYTRYCTYRRVV